MFRSKYYRMSFYNPKNTQWRKIAESIRRSRLYILAKPTHTPIYVNTQTLLRSAMRHHDTFMAKWLTKFIAIIIAWLTYKQFHYYTWLCIIFNISILVFQSLKSLLTILCSCEEYRWHKTDNIPRNSWISVKSNTTPKQAK